MFFFEEHRIPFFLRWWMPGAIPEWMWRTAGIAAVFVKKIEEQCGAAEFTAGTMWRSDELDGPIIPPMPHGEDLIRQGFGKRVPEGKRPVAGILFFRNTRR